MNKNEFDESIAKLAMKSALNGIDLEKTMGTVVEIMKPIIDLSVKNYEYILKTINQKEKE